MKTFVSTLAAGALALAAASAAAAQPAPADQGQPASPPDAMAAPAQPLDSVGAQAPATPSPAPSDQAPSASASGLDTSATTGQPPMANAGVERITQGNDTLVTNGPVPDTAANRAKYGGPMSKTGKKTKPAGN
jgi:hypothetical protein